MVCVWDTRDSRSATGYGVYVCTDTFTKTLGSLKNTIRYAPGAYVLRRERVAASVHFGSSRRASPVAACARRPFAAAERLHALKQLLELRLLLALGEPARRLVGKREGGAAMITRVAAIKRVPSEAAIGGALGTA